MAFSRLFVGALFHLFVSAAALNAEGRKVASGSLRSTHKRSASAFRAASHAQRGKLQRQIPAFPFYIPKIGLANVTEPTAYPPPPPVLDPYNDTQPLDTAIGYYLLSGFMAQPTVTPPPTQASLDLAFSCPLLLSWPLEVSVGVPDACHSETTGNWTGLQNKEVLLNWHSDCLASSAGVPQPTAVTTYTLPGGDIFGKSQERKSPFGTIIDLIDCGDATVFTVEEKLYKYVGVPHKESCEKYQSCDGTVYLQYFIKNGQGTVVALTPYLNLFQKQFDLNDPSGLKIATLWRNGWDPTPVGSPLETCSGKPRRSWTLQFVPSPPGVFATGPSQWPLAAMMTMLSQRDGLRLPNGGVVIGMCERNKTLGLILLAAFGVFLFVGMPLLIVLCCAGTCSKYFHDWESRNLPKRISKPAIYGN